MICGRAHGRISVGGWCASGHGCRAICRGILSCRGDTEVSNQCAENTWLDNTFRKEQASEILSICCSMCRKEKKGCTGASSASEEACTSAFPSPDRLARSAPAPHAISAVCSVGPTQFLVLTGERAECTAINFLPVATCPRQIAAVAWHGQINQKGLTQAVAKLVRDKTSRRWTTICRVQCRPWEEPRRSTD